MWKSILAIALDVALRALLRWFLGLKLNGLLPSVPLGMLPINLIGGYIIGAVIAYFARAPGITPEWWSPIIAGFCGDLTTFSIFSAEAVSLFQEGRLDWAVGAIATHVSGPLLMTLLGLFSMNWMLGK